MAAGQLGTPGAAADGSGSAAGGGLPTLPQEVVAKLLEALWTPMYSVRGDGGSTLMATGVRAALPLVVLSLLVGCLRHPALPASEALLRNALIVGRKLLKR